MADFHTEGFLESRKLLSSNLSFINPGLSEIASFFLCIQGVKSVKDTLLCWCSPLMNTQKARALLGIARKWRLWAKEGRHFPQRFLSWCCSESPTQAGLLQMSSCWQYSSSEHLILKWKRDLSWLCMSALWVCFSAAIFLIWISCWMVDDDN